MNLKALSSVQIFDPGAVSAARLKRQLAGLCLCLPVSLSLEGITWHFHFSYYKKLSLVLSCVPIAYFVLTSLRRFHHPDHPSSRWTEDSSSYRRYKSLRLLRWLASGAFTLSPILFVLLGVMLWGKNTRRLPWELFLLVTYWYIPIAYAIWRVYCQDRTPLKASPPDSPGQMQSIQSHFDKWEDLLWKRPAEMPANIGDATFLHLEDKMKPARSAQWGDQPDSSLH